MALITVSVNKISIGLTLSTPDGEIGFTKAMIKEDIIASVNENPGGDKGLEFYAEELASILIRIKNSS